MRLLKSLIGQGRVRATRSACDGASEAGLHDLNGICGVILSLNPSDLHKSMTTHKDHRIWQDVYHTRAPDQRPIYLKLTVIDDLLVVSFKGL